MRASWKPWLLRIAGLIRRMLSWGCRLGGCPSRGLSRTVTWRRTSQRARLWTRCLRSEVGVVVISLAGSRDMLTSIFKPLLRQLPLYFVFGLLERQLLFGICPVDDETD